MKYIVSTVLILILAFSCKKKEKAFEPYCKLSEAEMINVMVDFSLVKSAKAVARKELKDSGVKPYAYLFAKYGVDSVIINENLKYYNLDLDKSKKLFDTVSKIIALRSENLQIILDTIEAAKKKQEKDTLKLDVENENVRLKDFIPEGEED